MRFLLAIMFLLPGSTFVLKAQDLTGQWTGSSTSSLSEKKHKIILNISAGDSLFGGVLHWYYPETQYFRQFIVSGHFHSRDSTLSIREDSADQKIPGEKQETTVNYSGTPGSGTSNSSTPKQEEGPQGRYLLHYKRNGHKEVLEGHWSGREPVSIRLEKKAPPFIPLPPVTHHPKKDSAREKQWVSLLGRQTPLISSVPVPAGLDSVKIELYDNGEIDGDSVSLYLNDERILAHLELKAQAKTLWIRIDRSLPVNRLVLFAENLGKLPPNTALLEVTVRGKKHTIFLSTDYKRNAMVEFNLQE
ncbi:hypothetical protein ACX0G9_10715 [Flavitalea flava]